jgi:tetratricopeptide repeat protein 30
MDAEQALGYQADLSYNIALCYYRMKQFGPSLKHLAEIIERGVRQHPELGVGARSEAETDGGGAESVRSVGNTPALKESALVEAFNLKAAIEYVMKNAEATREALTDMPPRAVGQDTSGLWSQTPPTITLNPKS